MHLQQTQDSLKEPLVQAASSSSEDHEDESEYYQPGGNDMQTIDNHHHSQHQQQHYYGMIPSQTLHQGEALPQDVMYNLPPPIGYVPPQQPIQQLQYNQQIPLQQVYIPESQATVVPNLPGDVTVDEQGRLVMKAPRNYFAWVFFIVGLIFLWFPFVAIPFLIIALIARDTDFIFDDRKRELMSKSCGAVVKFGCLDRQVIVPYSSVNDVVVEMDFSMRVNGVPGGKIFAVTSSGNVQMTKGYLNYYRAKETARKIMNLVNQRKIQY